MKYQLIIAVEEDRDAAEPLQNIRFHFIPFERAKSAVLNQWEARMCKKWCHAVWEIHGGPTPPTLEINKWDPPEILKAKYKRVSLKKKKMFCIVSNGHEMPWRSACLIFNFFKIKDIEIGSEWRSAGTPGRSHSCSHGSILQRF